MVDYYPEFRKDGSVDVFFDLGPSKIKTAKFFNHIDHGDAEDRVTTAQLNAKRWVMLMNALHDSFRLAIKSVRCLPEMNRIGVGETLEVGRELKTKNGRKIGNAIIVKVKDENYVVLVDFGNKVTLTAAEIDEQFWLGKLHPNIKARLGAAIVKNASIFYRMTE